jgi:CRP-like cAMP-binding protein
MSFLDHPSRTFTVRAMEDARLLVLRKDAFLQLMKQDSDLAVKLMWQLLRKLAEVTREAEARLASSYFNSEA